MACGAADSPGTEAEFVFGADSELMLADTKLNKYVHIWSLPEGAVPGRGDAKLPDSVLEGETPSVPGVEPAGDAGLGGMLLPDEGPV